MKLPLAAALLVILCNSAQADCPTTDIEKALDAPLDGFRMNEKPVEDIQSTEGGVWRIYEDEGGTLKAIIRIDAGESGRNERRLGIHAANAYGIAVTRIDYLRHAFIEEGGPNGTARRTTEYFYFCDGKLQVPPEQYATMDVAAYAKAAEEARAAMLDDKEVAALTKGLTR